MSRDGSAQAHVVVAIGAAAVGAHDSAVLVKHLPWLDVMCLVATMCFTLSLLALAASAGCKVVLRAWRGVRPEQAPSLLVTVASVTALAGGTYAVVWLCQSLFASPLVQRVGVTLAVAAFIIALAAAHAVGQRALARLSPPRALRGARSIAIIGGVAALVLVLHAAWSSGSKLALAGAVVTLLGVAATLRDAMSRVNRRAPQTAAAVRALGRGLWVGFAVLSAWLLITGSPPGLASLPPDVTATVELLGPG